MHEKGRSRGYITPTLFINIFNNIYLQPNFDTDCMLQMPKFCLNFPKCLNF